MQKILITQPSSGYELLDSGNGEKLERFGNIVVSRPDPQAIWKKSQNSELWDSASAKFQGEGKSASWKIQESVPKKWKIDFSAMSFYIKPSSFKHTGIFPEQAENWQWIKDSISKSVQTGKKVSVLNLFGYTGGATLAALSAGAEVAHIDGSKTAVTWARENAQASGLSEKPVRWIVDDAMAFLEREVRRGNKYDGIVMDPPAFGRGPKGEVWKIEEDLIKLVELCKKVLSDDPNFILINGYASGYSAIGYYNLLKGILPEGASNKIEYGELTIKESKSERLLPAGIFARWNK